MAAICFLLLVWVIAYFAVGNELLVPSLSDSLEEMGKFFVTASFWRAFSGSVLRALIAFFLSLLFALVFAVIAYLLPVFERIFAPVVSALRSLPVLAILLILLYFLGAGEAPVIVAFLSLFPMLYVAILAALTGIDERLIEAAKVCGAGVGKRVFAVYLPLSSPYILRQSAAGLSYSLKLVVSAEVLANTAWSLGGMMQEARSYAEIPQLFALVCAAFLAGLALEIAVTALAVFAEKKIR